MTLGDLLEIEPRTVPLLVLGAGVLTFFALMTGAWNPSLSSARLVGRLTWWVTPVVVLLSGLLTLVLLPFTARAGALSVVNAVCCVLALRLAPAESRGAAPVADPRAGRRAAPAADAHLVRRVVLVAVGVVAQVVAIGLPAGVEL
jgi:hypothetical protein